MRSRLWAVGTAMAVSLLGGFGLVATGEPPNAAKVKLTVVVTTSMIECATRDSGGPGIEVVRLVTLASCPGHFDATPADLERIARASLFVRHDYQGYLDAKLTRAGRRPRRAVSVPTRGPQTLPANYLAACRAIRPVLAAAGVASATKSRLAEVERRVREESGKLMARWRPRLKGRVVAASRLQAGFCRWAGLRVAATFDNADQASLKGLARVIRDARKAKIAAVVCNLQRGRREGRAIAARIGKPLIVLSNFPVEPRGAGYLGLLRVNVAALAKGLAIE